MSEKTKEKPLSEKAPYGIVRIEVVASAVEKMRKFIMSQIPSKSIIIFDKEINKIFGEFNYSPQKNEASQVTSPPEDTSKKECANCGKPKEDHIEKACPYNGHYRKGLYIGHEIGIFRPKCEEENKITTGCLEELEDLKDTSKKNNHSHQLRGYPSGRAVLGAQESPDTLKGCGKILFNRGGVDVHCGLNYGNSKEILGTYLCPKCEVGK